MHADVLKVMARPAWLGLIVVSVLCAAGAALWVGLQQDAGETSTTYVFGRRVGYLDRPLPVLEDHLNDLVNSVEFPVVFARIEERLQLQAEKDYDLTIGIVEDTQSLVEIEVRTKRSGDADRIARIVAEEMVEFVLEGQDLNIATEIDDLTDEISRLEEEQARLVALSSGVPPTTAKANLEAQLTGLITDPDRTSVGPLEGAIQEQLSALTPLADSYDRNASSIRQLQRDRSAAIVERSDIAASQASINQEWYRSITPVEPTSNLPVAIAMAFAAAVPAGLASAALVALNLNRRLNRREEFEARTFVNAS
jgi:hypothetical protein